MGIFAQGQPVARIVVPAVGKPVDVRGIHDAPNKPIGGYVHGQMLGLRFLALLNSIRRKWS